MLKRSLVVGGLLPLVLSILSSCEREGAARSSPAGQPSRSEPASTPEPGPVSEPGPSNVEGHRDATDAAEMGSVPSRSRSTRDFAGPEAGGGAPWGGTGALRGRVLYRGTPPPQTQFISEAGDIEAHVPIVDPATRGLKNVVVWLEHTPIKPERLPSRRLVLDQVRYAFEPHVLAALAGDELRIINSDISNHNVRSTDPANAFNLSSIPGVEVVRRIAPARTERAVELKCDVHPWMKAWLYVFEHPWFAVTDAQGRFEIPEVPAGKQDLRAHHADGGLSSAATVTVLPQGITEVTLELGGPE